MSAPSPLSVVIVDDDEFVAQSLRTILEARGSVRVAALGTKGAEAAALFNEHHPDIMLLDIRMPDLSGLAAGEAILAAHPKARIVFLTTFADDDYIVRALAIGARGYSSSRKLVVWPKRCIPSWKAKLSWDPMSPTA